jgi:lipopolysaccharide/colanic/teichoic acid biosynthesis glycosyltransferase
MYKDYFKRRIDLLLAVFLVLILLPISILVVILLLMTGNQKIFFTQDRLGKDGRLIRIIKFKTMNDITDKRGKLMPDKDRLTAVGKFLRRTSLDEIPQLLNVIKGEMSLVGPRPLLTDYLPYYTSHQARRHEVSPGITGWAQINGRNAVTWPERFELDVWYVENVSLCLDIKILLYTILKTFKREGISSPTSATMERFAPEPAIPFLRTDKNDE